MNEIKIYKHLLHEEILKRNDHDKMYLLLIFQSQFHLFYHLQNTLHKFNCSLLLELLILISFLDIFLQNKQHFCIT